MNSLHLFILVIALALSGCGRKNPAGGEPNQREQVGITFKSGKGLRIAEETKKIIELQIVEASDQKLAAEFSATVQIYRAEDASAEATGFVTDAEAKQLKAGQKVSLKSTNATNVEGKLVRLLPLAQSGRTEVLIDIPQVFKIGTTIEATFTAQEGLAVTAIPRSAVLKTAGGNFAYVVNGDYFFRTAIKTGAENADFVEIKDGLYSGDQIVKQPVMTLWVAELQAIKGGADND
jgi:hypothetical protein